jgi:UDP-GlcNAc3NAcA epimerase
MVSVLFVVGCNDLLFFDAIHPSAWRIRVYNPSSGSRWCYSQWNDGCLGSIKTKTKGKEDEGKETESKEKEEKVIKMKIMSIVGARPNFIKLAPLDKEITKRGLEHTILHTGQHYDYQMSKVFFDELEIPVPDYNLGINRSENWPEMMTGIRKIISIEKPDWVIVYGDTNSTLAGALAAAIMGTKLAHVEAGLRCFNKEVPEEVNRILIDKISDLHFCPTFNSANNIIYETHKTGNTVYIVGDLQIQAILENEDKMNTNILDKIDVEKKDYVLATIHRQENVDNKENMEKIIDALVMYDRIVVFPIHPRTQNRLQRWDLMKKLESCCLVVPPMKYTDFITMEENAATILTDSGGVQKEAYFFQVPCVTLRNETEWVETVSNGWNILVGTDKEKIVEALELGNDFSIIKPNIKTPFPAFTDIDCLYGDLTVAKQIVSTICGDYT